MESRISTFEDSVNNLAKNLSEKRGNIGNLELLMWSSKEAKEFINIALNESYEVYSKNEWNVSKIIEEIQALKLENWKELLAKIKDILEKIHTQLKNLSRVSKDEKVAIMLGWISKLQWKTQIALWD